METHIQIDRLVMKPTSTKLHSNLPRKQTARHRKGLLPGHASMLQLSLKGDDLLDGIMVVYGEYIHKVKYMVRICEYYLINMK